MMVDLVKIRQKAREKKKAEEPEVEDVSSEAVEPAASEKKTSGKGRKKKKRTGPSKGKKRQTKSESGSKTRGPKKPEKSPTKPAETDQQEKRPDPRSPREASIADEEPELPEASTHASPEHDDGDESRLSRFKRTAGVMEASEEEIDEASEDEVSDENLVELITFSLAGEQYAMEVDRLVEIIVPRRSTKVPNAAEEIIGIISLRGSIVTLLDLRMILGLRGGGEETEDTRVVVVQKDAEQIGFIVDRVLRVVKVDPETVEPHPVVSASEQNDAVRGVFVSGDTITIYLDLERIVESV